MNKVKKITMMIFFCVILFCNATYASANNSKEDVIKIGYIKDWGVIEEDYESGKKGYGYEYFEEIAKYTGHNYEFVMIEFEHIDKKIQNGEVDLVGTIGYTKERLERYEFTETPFGHEEVFLTALEGSDILFDDLETINNKSVTVLEDSAMLKECLDDYTAKNNISLEYRTYTSPSGLENRLYDLEVTETFVMQDNRKAVAKVGVVPVGFMAKKGNTELIEEINLALEEIQFNKMDFERDLYRKYFGDTKIALPSLTKEDKILLDKKDNAFTVLISTNHKPLSYIDHKGNASGILIDIMEKMAQDAGITFTYVFETETTTLNYDDIDISISLVDNPFVQYPHIETEVYFDLPMMSVGKTVTEVGTEGKIGLLDYHNFKLTVPNLVFLNSIDEMIESLKKDEIQHIIATSLSTSYILNSTGIDGYSIYPYGQNMSMRMMLSDTLSDYVEVFDKLIERLDPDAILAIVVEQGYQVLPEKSILDFLAKNPVVLIFMFSFVGFSAFVVMIIMHKIKKKELFEIINKDKLTGLVSSHKFHELTKEILQTAKPNDYVLISIDVDNFQYINEMYGFTYGSSVLLALATNLSTHYSENSLITREKDDIFLILTLNSEDIMSGQSYNCCSEGITEAIHEILGETYQVSVSKGKLVINNPLEPLEYMIDCVHSARILGKQIYGITLFEFTEEMRTEKTAKNKIVTMMEEALKNKEFKVFYQPRVELKGAGIVGAEALVRWIPDSGNIIFPDSFIPLFEKNGFITSLDYYVFEEVCSFISQYQETLLLPCISVNLSAITLLDDMLEVKLTNITRKYNLDNHILEIEITESAIVKDLEKAIKKIDLLKNAGFVISLDDFGSGQSSLTRLKDLHIDILKIDREFLTASLRDEKGVTIIKNVIKMAKEINMLTLAEGVETKEHVQFLQALDCDFAQGYYFGKPMNESDFRDIISNHIDLATDSEKTETHFLIVQKIRKHLQTNSHLVLSVFHSMPSNMIIVNSKLEVVLYNESAYQLFGCKTEDELYSKFKDLSPLYQPDGRLSSEVFVKLINEVILDGRKVFDWTHCNVGGVLIPCKVTLVRSNILDEYGGNLLIGYIEDRRPELLRSAKEERRDKKARAILDATPLTHNTWTRDFKTTSCNKQAYELFGLESEEEYLEEFFNLSPQFQPNGRESNEYSKELIQETFDKGYSRTKWLHSNLAGEEIPTEVTMVRIDEKDGVGGDFLAAFARDLRENMANNINEHFDSYFVNQISDKALFQTISQLSEDLFFAFDIRTSRIQYFGKMCHLLNLAEEKKEFPKSAIETNRVWHEDVPAILQMVDNMVHGICDPIDIRFPSVNGDYHYYRYIYKILFNDKDEPVFAAGKAVDVQEEWNMKLL